MTQTKNGDKVSIHYTGKLADGTVFDSSVGEDPYVFTLGEGDIIEGFEEGVLGMSVGEKKTLTLAPEKAYGELSDELLIEVPLAEMPADLELAVGDELELTDEDDQQMVVAVIELSDDTVKLDGNSPLAGKTLTFELELIAVG